MALKLWWVVFLLIKDQSFSLLFLYIYNFFKWGSLFLSPYPSLNFPAYPAHPTTHHKKQHHPLLHTQNTNKKMCLTPLTGLSKRGALKIPLLGVSLFVALFLTSLQNTLPTLPREKRRALWELTTKAKSLLWKCMVVFYQKLKFHYSQCLERESVLVPATMHNYLLLLKLPFCPLESRDWKIQFLFSFLTVFVVLLCLRSNLWKKIKGGSGNNWILCLFPLQ